MKVWAIVTAAGSSRRMGGVDKLMLPLAERPVLAHSLLTLQNHPGIHGIVVSASDHQFAGYQELAAAHGISKLHALTPGGAERQDSIRNALERLPCAPDDAVAIHDGARPGLSAELVSALLQALQTCDGCLPLVAVRDTIKQVGPQGEVRATLLRQELFAAQTPQVFRFRTIMEAHRKAHEEGYVGTDDCSLVERYGGRVVGVEGDYRNLKVTTPEDLTALAHLLGAS